MAAKVQKQLDLQVSEQDREYLLSIAEKAEGTFESVYDCVVAVLGHLYEAVRETDVSKRLKRELILQTFLAELPPVSASFSTFKQYASGVASLYAAGVKVPGSWADCGTLVKAANADLGTGRKRAPSQASGMGKPGAKAAKLAGDNIADALLSVLKGKGKDKLIATMKRHGWVLIARADYEKLESDAAHARKLAKEQHGRSLKLAEAPQREAAAA